MNFLKQLQELDFEHLDRTVTETVQNAALSVVEEYPDRTRAAPTHAVAGLTPAALSESRELSEIWQGFDFEKRKDEWEAAAVELKALRGTEEPAGSALQGWQRRAQDAEFKLYQMYSTLLSLPDPTPFLYLLATMAARVQDLEDSNRKLQAAADQAAADDAEVSSLIEKHQRLLESTKELQEELSKRDVRISEMSAAASEAEAARKELNAQATEMARLQRSLKSVKDEYESTQQSLFELQSRLENLSGSRQQEEALAAEELERVTKRAAELEMERRQLLGRLESAQAQAAAALAAGVEGGAGGAGEGAGRSLPHAPSGLSLGASVADPVLLEKQLAVREEQVTALSHSLEAAQRAATEAASRHGLEMATMKDQVSTFKLAVDRLEREVQRRPDPKEHQELRRRVEALQALVDVQMQAEGWSGEQVEATLKDPSAQNVTTVLQERTRKLSSEVNSLKRQVGERDKQIADLEVKIQNLGQDLARRADLVAKLEEHLAAAASAAAGGGGITTRPSDSGAAPGGGSTSGITPGVGSAARLDSLLPQLSGTLGILPEVEPPAAAGGGDAGTGGAGGGGGAGGDGGSLLDIVVSQRDRFRQRMVQLEEEKGQLSEELRKTRQQLQASRDDNVQLFEKVRYLERYHQKAAASGRTTVVRVDGAGVAQPAGGGDGGARGSRYQCGPFALEVGGGGGADGAAAGGYGSTGPGAGGRFGGAGGAAGAGPAGGIRSRGARRGAGSQVLACFGDGDDPEANATAEARAARAYEARVNPFAEFQQSEAEMRVKNLQVHDRAVLAGSKLLLGSRIARMFFAVYTLMLHFVILLLFFYATTPCPSGPLEIDPAAGAQAMALAAAAAAAAAGAAGGGAAGAVGGTGLGAAGAGAGGGR
ncbi:hypothetical protein HYH03_012894 [Edaphochlamys debaryana]|uniref:CASP C-terminal domain-containing protein n=1 Tax=Edaphochlamys debaryana TaxID=47281 RepID=A0A836BTP8_9CHLO|nr:hypothetical protein HYH03_012894 [Edaphochlamys debaryana]|eukprot:KAG2488575.1 hypothetical protein HYH03_012894 [Edaphochlamys debaryana]